LGGGLTGYRSSHCDQPERILVHLFLSFMHNLEALVYSYLSQYDYNKHLDEQIRVIFHFKL